jgi:3',5'-cyclic AMP phosphodiesterase CpdA
VLRIAHISDLHVLDLEGTRWHQFLNKRLTGAMNLAGIRRDAHPVGVCETLARRLAQADIDHVIITGDLTNLALDSEFRRARQIVEMIGPPAQVTMIPGNHDTYTRGALRHHRFERWFAPYLVDDADAHHTAITRGRLHYPFVRSPAPHVRIYGLSSAIPTPPFLAFGHVGRAQLERLEALVAAEPPGVAVRIVLVHHNLHHRMGMAEYVASLYDRKAFSAAMHRVGASVVLHGHTHHPHQGHLPGGKPQPQSQTRVPEDAFELDNLGGDIPVLGCGSSTWTPPRARTGQAGDRARFNVLEVSARRIEAVRSFLYRSEVGNFEPEHDDLLDKALHARGAIAL